MNNAKKISRVFDLVGHKVLFEKPLPNFTKHINTQTIKLKEFKFQWNDDRWRKSLPKYQTCAKLFDRRNRLHLLADRIEYANYNSHVK